MRAAVLAASADEDGKRSHQATEAQCRAEGLQFVPLVAEACGGGWGPTAVRTWKALGALHAARSGEPQSKVVEQLQQVLSVALQRENARAVLRRLPAGVEEPAAALADP